MAPPRELLPARLVALRLGEWRFASIDALLKSQVAVQAQDYAGAKWALGLRVEGLTDALLDAALAEGRILRTHVMRPTWHLVAPQDLRWLLALTAARVHAAAGTQYRQLGFTAATFRRSQGALQQALEGGRTLTRPEARAVMERGGVALPSPLHALTLLMAAELDGVICSGPMRGKQHTYALFDERVPASQPRDRASMLGELARRYFTSRGPASLADFAWWSGLTVADAWEGLHLAEGALHRSVLDGSEEYWSSNELPATPPKRGAVWLLPNYDEYLVAYTDRSAAVGTIPADHLDARGNILFNHTLLIDGRVRGIWRRTLTRKEARLEVSPFAPLSNGTQRRVKQAVIEHARFLGLPVRVQIR